MGCSTIVPGHGKSLDDFKMVTEDAHMYMQYTGLVGGAQVARQVWSVCGIKVNFWGSGTLKIVIYVKNYPQKRSFRLAVYHPPLGGGC